MVLCFRVYGDKDTNKRVKTQVYLQIFEREYLKAKVKVTESFG